MNKTQLQHLTSIRDGLRAAEPYPWSNVTAVVASIVPLVRHVFPDHVSAFDAARKEPDWLMLPRVVSGGGTWDLTPRRDNFAEAAAAEDRHNRQVAARARDELVAFLDGLILLVNSEEAATPATDGPSAEHAISTNALASSDTMKIFVSHSSADRDIAGAFVDLLRAALPLASKDIRCTSVDGYKLPAGTNADDQLRQEVFEADAFVALLSPNSLASVYVMFELGARWAAKRYLVPLVIRGITPGHLKAPLSAIHAVSAAADGDLHQLLDELGARLSLQAEKPHVYMKAMRAFMAAAAP